MMMMAVPWFRKTVYVIVVAFLLPVYAEAKVYLVSVGISDYPGSSIDLALPAQDARMITWIYSKNTRMQYCLLLDEKLLCL